MYLAYKKEYLNKILFIVLLTIFIIMCLVSSCFANDSIVFSNGETFPYVLPNDLLDNYVISYYTSNGIDNSVLDILAWDNTTKIVVDDTGGFKKYSIDGVEGEGTVYKYRYYPDGSCFPNYSVSSSSSGFEFIFNSSYAYYISPGAVVYNSSGDIIAEGENTFKEPYIINTQEELESGKFDTLNINSADLIEEEFYLFSYYYSDSGEIENIYPRKEILLDGTQNNYYVGTDLVNGGYVYEIPFSQLGIDLVEGKKYGFKLATKDENGNVTKYYSEINFTIGTVSEEDVTNSKLEEQTDAIKENTETNKGIWESIKEILSYLNPFSEKQMDNISFCIFGRKVSIYSKNGIMLLLNSCFSPSLLVTCLK